jgi:hypothetical protein
LERYLLRLIGGNENTATEIKTMFLSDPQSEMFAANQRLADARRDVAAMRLGATLSRQSGGTSRVSAALDAALVRASRGASERQASRARRRGAARSCPTHSFNIDR